MQRTRAKFVIISNQLRVFIGDSSHHQIPQQIPTQTHNQDGNITYNSRQRFVSLEQHQQSAKSSQPVSFQVMHHSYRSDMVRFYANSRRRYTTNNDTPTRPRCEFKWQSFCGHLCGAPSCRICHPHALLSRYSCCCQSITTHYHNGTGLLIVAPEYRRPQRRTPMTIRKYWAPRHLKHRKMCL